MPRWRKICLMVMTVVIALGCVLSLFVSLFGLPYRLLEAWEILAYASLMYFALAHAIDVWREAKKLQKMQKELYEKWLFAVEIDDEEKGGE